VTSGFVTIAFLLALRLLIKDFLLIDIACSFLELLTDGLSIAQGVPNQVPRSVLRLIAWNQQFTRLDPCGEKTHSQILTLVVNN
jgi:hypothetical protein